MRFSRKLALKVGAVGVAAGAILAPMSAAHGTTGPTVVLSPSTGVNDGDSLTVTGSGFPASQPTVYIVQCHALTGQTACNIGGLVLSSTDASGAFTAHITVHTGTIGDGSCNAGDTCYVGASTSTTPDSTNYATGSFTFAGPPAGPTVTVTPSTGVKNNQTVTVTGSNFKANQPTVYLIECSGTTGQDACDVGTLNATSSTDGSGAFTGHIKVHSGAVGNGVCKAGKTCYIAAATATDQSPGTYGIGTFTFAASTTVATTTTAKYSAHKHSIGGKVTALGRGVKGLKTELDRKSGKHWLKVATTRTGTGGTYVYKHIKKTGKYEVKTLPTSKYRGSTSRIVKV
jgi:hypothetical protein